MRLEHPVITKPASGQFTNFPASLDAIPYIAEAAPTDETQEFLNLLVDAINAVQVRLGAGTCSGRLVVKTATLTSAAGATPVDVVTDAEVGATGTFYPLGGWLTVNGATQWATVATVKLQDKAGSPVDLLTVNVAALVGNTIITLFPQSGNQWTFASPWKLGTGATLGKGVQMVADVNGTGSDIVLTLIGIVK